MKKHISTKTLWIVMIAIFSLALVACGGSSSDGAASDQTQTEEDTATVSAGDPANGEAQYNQLCIACHGPGGEGVENLGKPFTTSDFLREKNDEEMLTFVKTGRPISDPLNTTGVDMPPKGGNPALNDEQIMDIIAYIRTLQ